jgi:hypothetical protein
MKAHALVVLIAAPIVVSAGLIVFAQKRGRGADASAPYPVVSGKAYKFETISEGVYYATATGSLATGSNNTVIVGDRGVLVVDTGTSPAAARCTPQLIHPPMIRPLPADSRTYGPVWSRV